jgi:hypothetical protein
MVRKFLLSLIVTFLCGFDNVYAQNLGDSDIFLPINNTKQDFSLDQIQNISNNSLVIIEDNIKSIRKKSKQARENKDVVKFLCLNDKLNQADVLSQSAKDHIQSLSRAIKRNDIESARYEFEILHTFNSRMRSILQEVDQCIGEDIGIVDKPNIRFTIDSDIVKNDPIFTQLDLIIILPPTISSPIR